MNASGEFLDARLASVTRGTLSSGFNELLVARSQFRPDGTEPNQEMLSGCLFEEQRQSLMSIQILLKHHPVTLYAPEEICSPDGA